METKEKNYQSVLKTNIISFLTYGILIGFIFVLVVIIVRCALHDISNTFLTITLSLISGIIIYNLLRFVCRTSAFETFKENKLSAENTEKFIRKMNVFFMICIIVSVLICASYLFFDNWLYTNAINSVNSSYNFISEELSTKISIAILVEYHNLLPAKLCSAIIIELSFTIAFLSLMTYQKKLVEKFNET